MKLVTLDILLKMPHGTIFQKYRHGTVASQPTRFIGGFNDSISDPDYQ
jgi:hypothetical protein